MKSDGAMSTFIDVENTMTFRSIERPDPKQQTALADLLSQVQQKKQQALQHQKKKARQNQ